MSANAFAAMFPYLTKEYGNAGALYKFGRRAEEAVQKARKQVAVFLDCSPEHIIFTSGGSESNNTVFAGLRQSLSSKGKKHLLISAIEHDSVLRAAQALVKDGFSITYLLPCSDGTISPESVRRSIRPDTGLCSVMYVNNETGAKNNIIDISGVCKAHDVFIHSDCVQAAGQYDMPTGSGFVDFASISSHKIHGPKGVGALYVKDKNYLPLIYGGADQEFGMRGGTENVPGIVGFGEACKDAVRNAHDDLTHIYVMKQHFYNTLLSALEKNGCGTQIIHVNGPDITESLGKILNFRIDGVDAETLLLMLDANDICASAGSACCSHEATPSHVLTAMGLTGDEARSSVRVSFSRNNTMDEMETAANVFANCIAFLRNGGTY